MRRFDLVRACFWLLAVVIVIITAETAFALGVCGFSIMAGGTKMGGCTDMASTMKDLLLEVLASILALLLAARNGHSQKNGNGPKPKE